MNAAAPPTQRRSPRWAHALTLATALLAVACGTLPVAQMDLPAALAATAPLPLTGLRAARSGDFDLGGTAGRFERGADRLSFFDALTYDRVSAGYTLSPGTAGSVTASCRARQLEGNAGLATAALRPYGLRCRYQGGWVGELTLDESKAALGTQHQRSGRLQGGNVVLDLRSVHRVQGSPLPLEAPIGYVFSLDGQPVGAVEINGTTPRVWRPTRTGVLQDAVTHAAITLALIWDPATN